MCQGYDSIFAKSGFLNAEAFFLLSAWSPSRSEQERFHDTSAKLIMVKNRYNLLEQSVQLNLTQDLSRGVVCLSPAFSLVFIGNIVNRNGERQQGEARE